MFPGPSEPPLTATHIKNTRCRLQTQDVLDDINFAFGQRWIAHEGSIGYEIDFVEKCFPPVGLTPGHGQRSALAEAMKIFSSV